MMGYNFPNNPTVGQFFVPPGGIVYRFSGDTWDITNENPPVDYSDAYWSSRSDLVDAITGGLPVFDGKEYTAGGYQYIGNPGVTIIPDLPGMTLAQGKLPRPQDFGGTDWAAFDACVRYARANIGEMFLDTLYELNNDIDCTGTNIRGNSKACVDFTSRPGFANGALDGFMKWMGTIGSKVLVARDMRVADSVQRRPTSITRVGTVLTFAGVTPNHGYAVGDPIWSTGLLSTTPVGQEVFYTQNKGSTATRTQPFIVSEVVSPSSFKVTCPDTGDTSWAGQSLYIRRAADVIMMPGGPSADLSAYYPKQRLLCVSEAVRTDGASENIRVGEYQTVSQLFHEIGGVWLHGEIRENYLVSDGAGILTVSTIIQPIATGFRVKGHGPNLATTGNVYGDRGPLMMYAEGPVIDLTIEGVDQMGVQAWSCLGGSSRIIDIGDGYNEAGRSTGKLAIQYGAVVAMATEGHVTWGCHISGKRHGIVQSATGTAGHYGVVRNWKIVNNTIIGCWLGGISTHMSMGGGNVMANNTVEGSETGADIRAGDWFVANNKLEGLNYGYYVHNSIGKTTLINNEIRGGYYAIAMQSFTNAASIKGPLQIKSNRIVGGEKGFSIYTQIAGSKLHIECDDNDFIGQWLLPVDIEVGSNSPDDGWTGSVSRNSVLDFTRVGSTYAFEINNAKNARVDSNNFIAPPGTWTSGAIRVQGAGSVSVRANGNIFPGAISEVVYTTGAPPATGGMRPVTEIVYLVPDTDNTIVMTRTDPLVVIIIALPGGAGNATIKVIQNAPGLERGQIVLLRNNASAQQITVVASGNIRFRDAATSRLLSSSRDSIMLYQSVTEWDEIVFADMETAAAAALPMPAYEVCTPVGGVVTLTKTNPILLVSLVGVDGVPQAIHTITPAIASPTSAMNGQIVVLRSGAVVWDFNISGVDGNIRFAEGFITKVIDTSRDSMMLIRSTNEWNETPSLAYPALP